MIYEYIYFLIFSRYL